jgi:hypothetical protein
MDIILSCAQGSLACGESKSTEDEKCRKNSAGNGLLKNNPKMRAAGVNFEATIRNGYAVRPTMHCVMRRSILVFQVASRTILRTSL